MANKITKAEAWVRAHEVFSKVNFNAFDYNTIKESLLDYMKLYFPEDFNDYIESSEFIAILEIFSYVGELIAYRVDLNAHENFISTAERKESILRLAKLISYKVSRNIPARGLVKITSIQTTEKVIDSNGRNLANTPIVWNDLNNPDWKEQFIIIMNKVLEQNFGTVTPSERVQIEDVLFELYTFKNQPLRIDGISTLSYVVNSNGISQSMELVPVELTKESPKEKRPERNAKLSILYGSDGLGDGSDTTGFFLFTKQGTMFLEQKTFDGVTPNQTLDILVDDINETDVWLNNVDPTTRETLTVNPYAQILPHMADNSGKYGEWNAVDSSNSYNILFNTNNDRQKYEIETLDNDNIRLVFGDGEFSDIPSGDFDLWYRISANTDSSVQKSSVIDKEATFSYFDANNSIQTFTFKFSLINSLQNSSQSEDIEHIRRVASSVYYTQDRMVNGEDYNSFMLQNPSILKLQSINRTFSGDSKYIAWHDPKAYYEDVKIFGDDLALYWLESTVENGGFDSTKTADGPDEVIKNNIEPLLCGFDFFNVFVELFKPLNKPISDIRCSFNTTEYTDIFNALTTASTSTNPQVDLYFSTQLDEWKVDDGTLFNNTLYVFMIRVEAQFNASVLSYWTIRWKTKRLNTQSETTYFRNTNTIKRVINFDTLSSNDDNILILKANTNGGNTSVLSSTKKYNVLGQELIPQNLPDAGTPDLNRLSVLPTDVTNDNIPDDLEQSELLDGIFDIVQDLVVGSPMNNVVTIPQSMTYIDGYEAESVTVYVNNVVYPYDNTNSNLPGTWYNAAISPPNVFEYDAINIIVGSNILSANIRVVIKNYVYFNRVNSLNKFKPVDDTPSVRASWYADLVNTVNDRTYIRMNGRYPLNFAWFYTTPRFHLVDPAASNIIDTYIVTSSYYDSMVSWVESKDDNAIRPVEPTPLSLRTAYNSLVQNAMISDTMILHSGKFKVLFGRRADPELQASFKVIRPSNGSLTDNEVKVRIVDNINKFFDINDWDFGSTFYFTELASSIHSELNTEINSVVLVPKFSTNTFGDLFQVVSLEDEIFIPSISTDDIEIVQSYTQENIKQI